MDNSLPPGAVLHHGRGWGKELFDHIWLRFPEHLKLRGQPRSASWIVYPNHIPFHQVFQPHPAVVLLTLLFSSPT